MLLNTIPYESDFPVHIAICDIQEYPVHYHQDLEIVYMLKGSAILKNGCSTDTLSQGDIYTISPRSVHGIRGLSDDNSIAVFHVNNDYLVSHFPDAVPFIYRTLLDDKQDPDLGWLRELLLQLITAYFRREEGYLDACTALLHKVITLINQRFIVFSIGEDEIRDFDREDTVFVERMTRIFKYIGENLEGSASLAELAEQENLSTFYLSHLIKESTGCGFRDLVSFMRAERSEILLLEGDVKISRIARSCGFSTSKYYEEAFLRWYHTTPQQHVATYRHMRLDATNLPRMDFLSIDDVLETVSGMAFHVIAQNRLVSAASHEPVTLHFGPGSQTISHLDCRLTVSITMEDLHLMRGLTWETLESLQCKHVILYQRPEDDPKEIKRYSELMLNQGVTVTISQKSFVQEIHRYGNDTLASPICFLLDHFYGGRESMIFPLRDQTDGDATINGGGGIYAPAGVHKPLYDTLFTLARTPGDLKLRGRHYALYTWDRRPGAYFIVAFNYSDEILQLCREETTLQTADQVIRNFRDELDLRFRLDVPAGTYSLGRYTYTHHSSLFHFLSQRGFNEPRYLSWRFINNFLFSPHAEGRLSKVDGELEIDVTLRGLSMQFILIQPEE